MEQPPSPTDLPGPPGDETEPVLEIQEVRYSMPLMLRELQIERTRSFFAKEILDQVEINKMFALARKARARRKQR